MRRAAGVGRIHARPDASFALREVGSGQVGSAEFVEYLMTSQTWRGIPWKHQLFVLRPAKLPKDVRHGLLVVAGGRWKPEYEGERKQATLPGEALLFAHLAEAIAAPSVLRAHAKHRHLRLGVELLDIGAEGADRGAELGAVGEGRQ